MRSLLYFIIISILVSQTIIAQDIIIKRDGEEITSKILEVDTEVIRYKRYDNLDGPTFVIRKAEIFMVRYANGTKEVFDKQPFVESKLDATSGILLQKQVEPLSYQRYIAIGPAFVVGEEFFSDLYGLGFNFNIGAGMLLHDIHSVLFDFDLTFHPIKPRAFPSTYTIEGGSLSTFSFSIIYRMKLVANQKPKGYILAGLGRTFSELDNLTVKQPGKTTTIYFPNGWNNSLRFGGGWNLYVGEKFDVAMEGKFVLDLFELGNIIWFPLTITITHKM